MPLEARLLTGITIAAAVVYWTTPLAIQVADRFHFYDRPVGYKAHGRPTPYLGGAAVVTGFLLAAILLAGHWDRTIPLIGGVAVLWAVGTADDRFTIAPRARVVVEMALAVLLWSLGLGWDLGAGAALDLVVTVFWVVAVVNAFNLFDNMDGAAPSMAAVVAAGLAIFGAADGNAWLAVTAAALCGACIGFLPHNLASPARIFLGDGGSMPIGFAVAALAMIGVSEVAAEWQSLAMGLLFVGVPALDTMLVMVSRTRRGVSILTGGRDHLTHRTHKLVSTARGVAVALGGAQAVVSALAIIAIEGGSTGILAAVVVYLVGVGIAIALLDTRVATEAGARHAGAIPASRGAGSTRRATGMAALIVLVPLVVSLGASPFFGGYYDSGIWVPAGLGLVVAVTAGLIARPPSVNGPTALLVAGLGALALWSLASTLWADSIEQAVLNGNRLIVYVVLAGLLLVLVRSDRVAVVVVAAMAVTVVGVAAVTLVRMLGSAPTDLFVAGRLDAPLGYINGQASFYLVGFWACLAVAEQRRHALAAGAALGGATLLGCLLVLSQSRGVAVAFVASCLCVLVLVPGRLRRAWALVLVGAGVLLASSALVDVYDAGLAGSVAEPVAHAAARGALVAACAVGLVWTAVSVAGTRPGVAELWPVALGALVAGALAVGGVAVIHQDDIRRTVRQQYTVFVRVGVEPQGSSVAGSPTSRLVSGAGTRYDYWRIAWHAWKERPVAGVGAGGYDRPYFLERATTEDVRQPHSIELQMLSELGIVGALLLAVAFAGLGWGIQRAARGARTSGAKRVLAVAGIGAVAGWVVHTSVDWIHLLPGVTGLVLVAVVLLTRAADAPVGAPDRRPRGGRVAIVAMVASGLIVAGVSLSRQGLAEHFRHDARAALASRPGEALHDVDRSLRLDPEAVESYYIKAAAFARFNQAAAARAALEEAARREPGRFVTWALLGDLAVRTGDLKLARARYQRAHSLNPRDPTLRRLATDPGSSLNGTGR